MRRGNDPKFIYLDDNKTLVAVDLGCDFTSEHEWGIKRIQQDFGIKNEIDVYGMAKRKINTIPKNFIFIEKDQQAGFVYGYYDKPERIFKHEELNLFPERKYGKTIYPAITLAAAWSESDFSVISDDKAQIELLFSFREHFRTKNIFIMLGGGHHWLKKAGLLIGIADRLPKETVELWETADKDYHQIRKEFEATGIEKLLKEKKKDYFALRPERDKKDGGLVFWLNPMNQDRTNFGWFKLDDLREWAEDKGRIPMTEEQKKKR